MSIEVDLSRLIELRELDQMSGEQWRALVQELLENIANAIDPLEARAADGDFDELFRLAHGARNDALLFGTEQLAQALGTVERAARREERAALEAAVAELPLIWRQTRQAIEAAAKGQGSDRSA